VSSQLWSDWRDWEHESSFLKVENPSFGGMELGESGMWLRPRAAFSRAYA
jgi:hypothetical protein